jgi:hypothetical protein
MSAVPEIVYKRVGVAADSPGYYVGTALDELAEWAIENGCPPEQFLERAAEAVERAAEDAEL